MIRRQERMNERKNGANGKEHGDENEMETMDVYYVAVAVAFYIW